MSGKALTLLLLISSGHMSLGNLANMMRYIGFYINTNFMGLMKDRGTGMMKIMWRKAK